MKELPFASMISSKILHDLAGPIGAILNGTELLAEGGGNQDEVVDLLETSVNHLNAQLQAFRLAFGALSSGYGDLDSGEFQGALENYARVKGFSVSWNAESDKIDKDMVKLIMNGAFLLGEAVRKKGELQISYTSENDHSFSIAAFGDGVELDENVKKILNGDDSIKMDPKNMSAFIVQALGRDLGISVSLEESPNGVVLRGLP